MKRAKRQRELDTEPTFSTRARSCFQRGKNWLSGGEKSFFFLMNKVQTYIDLHKQIVYLWYLNFTKGGRLWNGCQKGSLSGDNGKKKRLRK